MDPWKDRPGWRTELKWGIATLVALALCAGVAPLLPAMWLGGRWCRGADR